HPARLHGLAAQFHWRALRPGGRKKGARGEAQHALLGFRSLSGWCLRHLGTCVNGGHEVSECGTRVHRVLDTPKNRTRPRRVRHSDTPYPPFPHLVSTTRTLCVPQTEQNRRNNAQASVAQRECEVECAEVPLQLSLAGSGGPARTGVVVALRV